MKIKFWGVRGSIPCPGPKTFKYGGNTLCVELRLKNPDRLIIIDAGTGIREFGNHMVAHDLPNGLTSAEIFLTHTHWDHIQGFPFFIPIYIPGTKFKVYGPVTYEEDTIKDVLGGQWISFKRFSLLMGTLAMGASLKNLSSQSAKQNSYHWVFRYALGLIIS